MKKLGLLPRLILGIILGIVIGNLNLPSIVRILATFNSIFGNFLGFTIPLIWPAIWLTLKRGCSIRFLPLICRL